MTGRALIAGLLVLAPPGFAQTAEEAIEPLRGCVGVAQDEAAERACVGSFARGCMTAASGETNAGMTSCVLAEAGAWDRLLDEDFAAVIMALRERAAVDEQSGTPPVPRDEMLRTAQDAWIAFRDADCAYDVAVYSGGSMGEVAGAYCTLNKTAQRALEIRAKRAELERE